MRRILHNKDLIAASIALFAFAVYCTTLAPTVTFIDSGELAAVTYTLGIAHPTGYPLFTLLGWFFAHLPLGMRTIFQLNLMAALFCSLALYFFFHLLVFLLEDFDLSGTGKSDTREEGSSLGKGGIIPSTYIAAIVGTIVLAFSETFWSQAVSLEVYSLHTLFLSLVLLFFSRAIHQHKMSVISSGSSIQSPVLWYSFAFFLGLSFTNHMTTILLAPGFLYLFFATHRFSSESWKKINEAVLPFLAGLSVYLYLPLRSAQEPMMNWGNPTTLEKVWWHFTGKQYRVWIFSSFESAEKQLRYFLQNFPSEFSF